MAGVTLPGRGIFSLHKSTACWKKSSWSSVESSTFWKSRKVCCEDSSTTKISRMGRKTSFCSNASPIWRSGKKWLFTSSTHCLRNWRTQLRQRTIKFSEMNLSWRMTSYKSKLRSTLSTSASWQRSEPLNELSWNSKRSNNTSTRSSLSWWATSICWQIDLNVWTQCSDRKTKYLPRLQRGSTRVTMVLPRPSKFLTRMATTL